MRKLVPALMVLVAAGVTNHVWAAERERDGVTAKKPAAKSTTTAPVMSALPKTETPKSQGESVGDGSLDTQLAQLQQNLSQRQALAGEQIKWQVIGAGGGSGSSTNYTLNGTIGQTAVGISSSTNYTTRHGYWQEFGGGICCIGATGNVDNDVAQTVDIGDLTVLIDHLFITFVVLDCHGEANVDGDPLQVVDIGDLTWLIDHLFITFVATSPCP